MTYDGRPLGPNLFEVGSRSVLLLHTFVQLLLPFKVVPTAARLLLRSLLWFYSFEPGRRELPVDNLAVLDAFYRCVMVQVSRSQLLVIGSDDVKMGLFPSTLLLYTVLPPLFLRLSMRDHRRGSA